jgi:hypothetical protein
MREKLDETISILWNDKPLKIKNLRPNKDVKRSGTAAA